MLIFSSDEETIKFITKESDKVATLGFLRHVKTLIQTQHIRVQVHKSLESPESVAFTSDRNIPVTGYRDNKPRLTLSVKEKQLTITP